MLVTGSAASGAERSPDGTPRPSVHSSDGVQGPIAAPMPRALLRSLAATDLEDYRVVPGLRYRHWLQTNGRGTVHAYLLSANLNRSGLSLEYVGPDHVSDRAALTDLLAGDQAVAGVNADFFDIADTGAPLGVGVDGGRVLHGPRSGWTTGFALAGSSRAYVGTVPVRAVVVRGPKLRITDVNTSHVGIDEIGLYTPRWGAAP